VVRALRDKDEISPQTKARIKAIAKQLKYRPNHIARSLSLGKSRFVGVVASPASIPTLDWDIGGVTHSLRDAGYSVIFYASTGDPESEQACLERLIEDRVAGVMMIPSSNTAKPEAYQELIESGTKMVVMGGCIEGLNAPQVVGDSYRAGRIATEHLISLGHERIAYFAIPQTCYVGTERVRGFVDALSAAGISLDPSLIVEVGFGDRYGAQAMMAMLARDDPPTAIVARHDVVAFGAMQAVFEAGLSVPEDFSIVGNADIWCSRGLRVPLTTVRHPADRAARLAVDMLLAMLSGKEVEPRTVLLDVELVVRSSSAAPRPGKPNARL